MGKIAFVFAGQGAQYAGMGAYLRKYPEAAAIFAEADRLRPGTSRQCCEIYESADAELLDTAVTQPCMFAVEAAAAAIFTARGVHPDMAAGFSLGELSALTFAGGFSFADGFKLVCERGRLMSGAAAERQTAMAAVVKLTAAETERICACFKEIYPVNYNSPGQTTVAGDAGELPGFIAAVKAAGGRAIPLKVSGGFHSPFMRGASESFRDTLEGFTPLPLSIPVYSNLTGETYGAELKQTLSLQLCSPVKWETSVRNMLNGGADVFIELGPGGTLCSLIQKIDGGARVYRSDSDDAIEKILSEAFHD